MNILNNLIAGGAWQTISKGLLVTVQISALGIILGTALGALFCAARLSANKIINIPVKIIISFLRGTPVLLLLMVIYFVVFSNIRVDAVLIAVLAFGLNSGAHIGEIMRAALAGIDKMQVEAARMLGASKTMAFWYIALPQAAKIAKPVYQNAVISTIQWTSVVGYVAIADLTRVVNNMGSRSGDPFLALFLGMLLYLAISYLVNGIFLLSERRAKRYG
ncbi:MAG: amino acid ABC transporter permease [Clostridiales bacterium]|jgi:His/Glu/Gln/Arg/opine family amino acid ABC transporter permease subunit|nr:amino acid ABC transporter permease [Clostridiales bacterium]